MYTYTETQETLQHMTSIYVDDVMTKKQLTPCPLYYKLSVLDDATNLCTAAHPCESYSLRNEIAKLGQ